MNDVISELSICKGFQRTIELPDILNDPKILTIPLSEPLWFCEKPYVFPNQCGGDHP